MRRPDFLSGASLKFTPLQPHTEYATTKFRECDSGEQPWVDVHKVLRNVYQVVMDQRFVSHTHQHTQHTNHLESQQQRQLQHWNQHQNQPAIENHANTSNVVQNQQENNVQSNVVADRRINAPLEDSNVVSDNVQPNTDHHRRVVVAKKKGAANAAVARKKAAAAKHVERMRQSRRQKQPKQRVYTNRDMPDSTAGRKLKQAPFHAYGRGNTHAVGRSVVVFFFSA